MKKYVIPVKEGERMRVTPTGKAEQDYYVKYKGFIIFIRGVPDEKSNEEVLIEVHTIKKTYGFANFLL